MGLINIYEKEFIPNVFEQKELDAFIEMLRTIFDQNGWPDGAIALACTRNREKVVRLFKAGIDVSDESLADGQIACDYSDQPVQKRANEERLLNCVMSDILAVSQTANRQNYTDLVTLRTVFPLPNGIYQSADGGGNLPTLQRRVLVLGTNEVTFYFAFSYEDQGYTLTDTTALLYGIGETLYQMFFFSQDSLIGQYLETSREQAASNMDYRMRKLTENTIVLVKRASRSGFPNSKKQKANK